ncbi:MAG TPA: DUF4058 family protein [Tepidisphaeraceae bacterium]|nr:DUF4058 family protein [Tepidisphaeraceae bacterium]
MPSPFPGMNPYLEAPGVWHKFHNHFCTRCLEALDPQVAPKYIVDVDENVYLHELPADQRRLAGRPDVFVSRRGIAAPAAPSAASLTAPMYAQIPSLAVDEERLPYLRILDRQSREVISVIELLSPSNKSTDRRQYVAKRQQYMDAGVALVEIDLLRAGARMPVDEPPVCDYCVMVFRPQESPRIGIWPINLRSPLPEIPVPLRAGEPDAKLALQPLLHLVYGTGGYERYIYENELEPPLAPQDLLWASEILAANTPR